MDCKEVLSVIRNEVLQKVAIAASAGETQQIVSLGRRLDLADKLMQRARELEHEVSKLLAADHEEPVMMKRSKREGETGREGGKQARSALTDALAAAGISLTRVKGATYKLATGALLGIAYATERNPNRWFLGLTKGRFDHAILLCEETPENVHPILLSADFLATHGTNLSESGDGVKFNVTRSGNIFYLNIPKLGALPVPTLDITSEATLHLFKD